MKKLIAALLTLLVLTVLAAFVWLPAVQQPQLSLKLKANQKALLRRLIQQSIRQQSGGTPANQLVLRPGMFEGMVLSVPLADTTHNSLLQLAALGTDSTLVTWRAVLKGGGAPWQRWQTSQQANHLEAQVRQFMATLHRWESDSLLYGLEIKREKVKDTTLVATRFETVQYPATTDIYQRVEQLQRYITGSGAAITNHPMLYVRRRPQSYEVMVGLPASRDLPNTATIEQKRMVMGNILMAEVRGGDAVVREGMRQLEDYVSDHGLVSPAIPFVSLVTDRRQEADSSRWVSRLYYPIL